MYSSEQWLSRAHFKAVKLELVCTCSSTEVQRLITVEGPHSSICIFFFFNPRSHGLVSCVLVFSTTSSGALSQYTFFRQLHCPIGISPVGNSGCFPQGKPTATESRYPTYGACWMFQCFHSLLTPTNRPTCESLKIISLRYCTDILQFNHSQKTSCILLCHGLQDL